MNKLTLLACLSFCSLVLLLTGCGDDQPNSTTTNTGTNANTYVYRCMHPDFPPSGMTLTPNDSSGPIRIDLDAAQNYVLVWQSNTNTENGTFAYTPSGHAATLILLPNTGNVTRTINLALTTSTQGTYTSDSLSQGSVTFDYPPVDYCPP